MSVRPAARPGDGIGPARPDRVEQTGSAAGSSFHDFLHIQAVTVRVTGEPVDWYSGQSQERLN
jgi:hypothetical protein